MGKVKTCKHCNAEIPVNAPRCRYCGSIQRAGCLGAAVVIICVFLAIVWIVVRRISPNPGQQSAASRVLDTCEQAVRRAAAHPGSVDFHAFGSQLPQAMRDGGYRVRLAFTEKNDSGENVARMAICTVKDGKLQTFRESKR